MECRYYFKHMKASEQLESHMDAKIRQKVALFVTKPIEAHVTFSVEAQEAKVHVSIVGGDGFNCQIETVSRDMYEAADKALDKLETQLRKQKSKLKNHKNVSSIRQLQVAETKDPELCENVPVDAGDLIKFEQAKRGKRKA